MRKECLKPRVTAATGGASIPMGCMIQGSQRSIERIRHTHTPVCAVLVRPSGQPAIDADYNPAFLE
jgi:hypothetical protein